MHPLLYFFIGTGNSKKEHKANSPEKKEFILLKMISHKTVIDKKIKLLFYSVCGQLICLFQFENVNKSEM